MGSSLVVCDIRIRTFGVHLSECAPIYAGSIGIAYAMRILKDDAQ